MLFFPGEGGAQCFNHRNMKNKNGAKTLSKVFKKLVDCDIGKNALPGDLQVICVSQ